MAENLAEEPALSKQKRPWDQCLATNDDNSDSVNDQNPQKAIPSPKRSRSEQDFEQEGSLFRDRSVEKPSSLNCSETELTPENIPRDINTTQDVNTARGLGADKVAGDEGRTSDGTAEGVATHSNDNDGQNTAQIDSQHSSHSNNDMDDGSMSDDDGDNVSEVSGMSDLSLEGMGWRPVSGPMAWVHRQMSRGVDPRVLLGHLLPGRAVIPPDIDQLMLWKIIINIVSEPPRRKKLPDINTLHDVIQLIKQRRNIVVLTGAGVSVSCGIPDFRSRDGIYARLAEEYPNLPDPQAMFDINYFKNNPKPFFKFAKEIYPGQFEPSKSHKFIKLLETHGKLLRNYTQNIDTLEQQAGIQNIIQCHGSFATATCMTCKLKTDAESIREDISSQTIPRCPKCPADEPLAILKPDIVFFGESLSNEFHDQMEQDKDVCDLLIVIGSSLKVRPVALIPNSLPPDVPQILINRESLRHLTFDVQLLGDCDIIVQELCHQLGDGWRGLCGGVAPAVQISLGDISTPPVSDEDRDNNDSRMTSPETSEDNIHMSARTEDAETAERTATGSTTTAERTTAENTTTTDMTPISLGDNQTTLLSTDVIKSDSEQVTPKPKDLQTVKDTVTDCVVTSGVLEGGLKAFDLLESNRAVGTSQACSDAPSTSVTSADCSDPLCPKSNSSSGITQSQQMEKHAMETQSHSEGPSQNTGQMSPNNSHDPDSGNNLHQNTTDSLDKSEEQQRPWRSKRYSLGSQIKEAEYLFLPPNRYVFKGAEVYDVHDEDDDFSDDTDDSMSRTSSSDSSSSADSTTVNEMTSETTAQMTSKMTSEADCRINDLSPVDADDKSDPITMTKSQQHCNTGDISPEISQQHSDTERNSAVTTATQQHSDITERTQDSKKLPLSSDLAANCSDSADNT